MDTQDALMRLLVGGMFAIFGIYTLLSGNIHIGFGIGTGYSIKLSGRRALLFGASLLIGGALFGLSFVLYWLDDLLSTGIFTNLPSIGVLITVFGLFVIGFPSAIFPDEQDHSTPKQPHRKIKYEKNEAIISVDNTNIADSDE